MSWYSAVNGLSRAQRISRIHMVVRGRPERVSVRSGATGHRLVDARTGGRPIQTRHIRPLWVLPVVAPLEIAARWRAKLESRYG